MASGVGSSPFNGKSVDVRDESEVEMLRKGHKSRMNRSAMRGRHGGRVSYNDNGLAQSSGYWKKPKRPEMRTLTDSLGNKYQTPDVIKWDDWLDIFRARHGAYLSEEYERTLDEKNIRSLGDLCHWSFDRDNSGYYSFDCPAGHISKVEYHNKTSVMRVTFTNGGDVVCYFYVPAQVYATLQHLSEGMPTRIGKDGKPRHLVGIYFWDLVRVRGTVHGNRYECVYTTMGERGGLADASGMSEEEISKIDEANIARSSGIAERLGKEGQHKAAGEMRRYTKEQIDAVLSRDGGRAPESMAPANAAPNLRDDAMRGRKGQ